MIDIKQETVFLFFLDPLKRHFPVFSGELYRGTGSKKLAL